MWLLGEGFTAGQIALFGIGVSERTCYRLIFSDRQGARSTVIYLVVVGLDGGVAVGAEGPFQIEEISPNARLRRTNAARWAMGKATWSRGSTRRASCWCYGIVKAVCA